MENRRCQFPLPSARDCLRSLLPPQDPSLGLLWPPESIPYHLGATVPSTSRRKRRPHTGTRLPRLAAYNQTKLWCVLSPWGFVLACCSPAISGNDCFPRLLLWDCQPSAAVSASGQASDAVLCSLESGKRGFSVTGTPHLVAWAWRAWGMSYKHAYFYTGDASSLSQKLKWAPVERRQLRKKDSWQLHGGILKLILSPFYRWRREAQTGAVFLQLLATYPLRTVAYGNHFKENAQWRNVNVYYLMTVTMDFTVEAGAS